MRPSGTTRGVRAASVAVDDAVGGDDAGEVQLGDDLDDARAADAGDAGARRRRSAKPGSSDQASTPMTRKRGSSVSRSMRTRSMAPGAARWPPLIWAPSKAGPGRARGGEQAVAGRRARSRRSCRRRRRASSRSARCGCLGEDHAGRVGADVAGDARQDVDAGAGMGAQLELRRGRARPRRSVASANGARAERRRVDAEQRGGA